MAAGASSAASAGAAMCGEARSTWKGPGSESRQMPSSRPPTIICVHIVFAALDTDTNMVGEWEPLPVPWTPRFEFIEPIFPLDFPRKPPSFGRGGKRKKSAIARPLFTIANEPLMWGWVAPLYSFFLICTSPVLFGSDCAVFFCLWTNCVYLVSSFQRVHFVCSH